MGYNTQNNSSQKEGLKNDINNLDHFLDIDDLESSSQKLDKLSYQEIFSYFLTISKNKQKEEEFCFLCYYLKDKLSNNNLQYIQSIKEQFKSATDSQQMEISYFISKILSYSNPRYFKNSAYIKAFSYPSLEEVSQFLSELHIVSQNKFIDYSLSFIEKNYTDIISNNHNFSQEVHQVYQDSKVPGNNIKVVGKQFGTVLQTSNDFANFSFRSESQGVLKHNKGLEFSPKERLSNDSFRLYDNISDIYIHHGLGENRIHNYAHHKNENFSIPESFSLATYSNEFLSSVLFYLSDNIIQNSKDILNIFSNIFSNYQEILQIFQKISNTLDLDNISKTEILQLAREIKKGNIPGNIQGSLDELAESIRFTNIIKQNDNREVIALDNYTDILKTHVNIFSNILPDNEVEIYLKKLHSPEIIHMINQDLQIDITNLTLQTQIHLLHFLWTKTTEEFEIFKEALSKQTDKYAFLNTFLACSKNPEIGDIILDLAEKEGGNKVIQKIGALLSNIDSHTDKLLEQFESESSDNTLLDVKKSIIEYSEKFIQKSHSEDIDNVLTTLESFDEEIISIFAYISNMSLEEISQIDIAGLHNISSHTYTLIDINNDINLKKQLCEGVAKNFPGEDFIAFQELLNSNSQTIFHTLETGDKKILYSFSSEKKDNNTQYIDWISKSKNLSSFNTRLIEKFLEHQFNFSDTNEKFEAIAEVDILTPLLFINKFGFVADGTSSTPEDTNNYGKQGSYLYLRKSRDMKFQENSSQEKKFSLPDDKHKLLEYVDNQKILKRVITKYIKSENNNYTLISKKLED